MSVAKDSGGKRMWSDTCRSKDIGSYLEAVSK